MKGTYQIEGPGKLTLRKSPILVTGSCFSTQIGKRLEDEGFAVVANPFGILFNPASIAAALERLDSGRHFTAEDVIVRDGRYVSFHHHGAFARQSPQAFLEEANAALDEACRQWQQTGAVILTLGTSWVFRHLERDIIVANCHKVPAHEFRREFLSTGQTVRLLEPLIRRHPEKKWIFTVSPIRHLADGAHGNQISKASLLLAIDELQKRHGVEVHYFPAYEILLDELRDYRWYAEDTVHPSEEAVRIICDRFISWIDID